MKAKEIALIAIFASLWIAFQISLGLCATWRGLKQFGDLGLIDELKTKVIVGW